MTSLTIYWCMDGYMDAWIFGCGASAAVQTRTPRHPRPTTPPCSGPLMWSEVKMKTKFNKPWLTSYIIKTSKMHKFCRRRTDWSGVWSATAWHYNNIMHILARHLKVIDTFSSHSSWRDRTPAWPQKGVATPQPPLFWPQPKGAARSAYPTQVEKKTTHQLRDGIRNSSRVRDSPAKWFCAY